MIKLNMPPNSIRYIDGKSVFTLYLMLKNHFQGKYDVEKYKWTMRISDSAYQKRKDRFFFEKLSTQYKLRELALIFISNLSSNQDAWIGEISDSDAVDYYRKYLVKIKSMKDTFEEDVKNLLYFGKKMNITINQIFKYNEDLGTSYIFKLLQSKIITTESFLMLDSFLNIIDKHDELTDNIIWNNYSVKLNAYKKIFKVNSEETKNFFISIVKEVRSK